MDKDEMVSILKETKIKYKYLLIDYPFQKNIHQLDKEELLECLFDLFTVGNNKFDNFQEMLYCKFGKAIAEKFLIPYNEKLYACDLNKLDKNAMGRFSLMLIRKILFEILSHLIMHLIMDILFIRGEGQLNILIL